ncbi:MAG: DUF29 domain-containing protein [Candidatus Tectomicrobia bacterium]|uniref:DUF29 domain-containing protein n=1 Tax=Tectimicrobiota bacterium TaxID=2528274 RepID=A0A938B2L4_UNCTE|nr:DUF29 domain-containing protein [Candidatus Tectomicrobia bacterium]
MGVPIALYEQDFYAWLHAQIQLLKARQFEAIDLDHLIDEIESLAAHEQLLVRHRLAQLLEHLYAWWWNLPERSVRWQSVIALQRDELADILADSPSLREALPDILTEVYAELRKKWLHRDPHPHIPEVCPWTPGQLLDETFLPEGQTLMPQE